MAEKVLGLYESCKVNPYVNQRGRFHCAAGDKIHRLYKYVWDEKEKCRVFKETGQVNIYDEIQSHRDSVDLQLMIKRYEQGDPEALNKMRGFYGDATKFPKNLMELFNFMSNAKDVFDSLPAEMREKFNNNPEDFMMNVGDFLKQEDEKAAAAASPVPDSSPVTQDVPKGDEVANE